LLIDARKRLDLSRHGLELRLERVEIGAGPFV